MTMTNREWLAGMTDKEFAIWLCQISTCTYCEFGEFCSREGSGTGEWLKKDHKETRNDS
jgi:hypothetical protein